MTTTVLITRLADNRFTARALALPDVVASGDSEREALEQLRSTLAALAAHSHLVQVDLPLPDALAEHPWLRRAGLFSDDPDWEAFQDEIARYRQEVDAREQPA
jgi:predicted RNase H-like HicB family nuclease